MEPKMEIGHHVDGSWFQMTGTKECALVLEWCGLKINERSELDATVYEMSIHNSSLKKANQDVPMTKKEYISAVIVNDQNTLIFDSVTEFEYNEAREFLNKAALSDLDVKVTY